MSKKGAVIIPVLELADEKLQEIKELIHVYEEHKREAEEEIRLIKDRHAASLQSIKNSIVEKEKALKDMLRKNRSVFFDSSDRVDLKNGSIFYQVSKRVKRARNVTVDVLESLGYSEAVKVAKSVDWDKIEKFTDEKLAAIGTERVEKEDFGYEIKK